MVEENNIINSEKEELFKQGSLLVSTRNFLDGHWSSGNSVFMQFVCMGYGMSLPVKNLSKEEVDLLLAMIDKRVADIEAKLGSI